MFQVTINRQFEFAAGHYLPNHKGLCRQVHGHNYIINVEVEGPIDKKGEEAGMVVDFSRLNSAFKKIKDILDHSTLNLYIENPTAENISIWIAERLIQILKSDLPGVDLCWVEVQENERSSATCYIKETLLEKLNTALESDQLRLQE